MLGKLPCSRPSALQNRESMLAPCPSSTVGRGRLLQGGRGGLLPPSGPGSWVLGPGIWHQVLHLEHTTPYTGAASFMEFFRDGKVDNGVNVLWEGGITDQV